MQTKRGSAEDTTETPTRARAVVCLGLILIALALLGGRLVRLQHVQHDAVAPRVERLLRGGTPMRTPRGPLIDAAGRELAVSVPGWGCAVDPAAVESLSVALGALTGTLELTPPELQAILDTIRRRIRSTGTCRFAWVRREITASQADAVRALRLPGVVLTPEWRRRYPQGKGACHLVGFTGRDGGGLEGLELISDALLNSRAGSVQASRDARRRLFILDRMKVDGVEEGLNMQLSLDSYVQLLADRELTRIAEKHKPESATILVMEPNTGDVVAMANWPSYDLNEARKQPPERRLNASVAAIYEPGSVFKPFVLAGALDAGVVKTTTPIFCENGAWNLGFRVLHDTHGYGNISAAKVVIKSSNIGIAKVARMLGMTRLHAGLSAFGFGQRTGSGLPGELPGLFRPLEKWNPRFSPTSIPMGQEVCVTPLQLVTAFSALVNGGRLMRPRVVRSVLRADGTTWQHVSPREIRRVISEGTSAKMRTVLGRVVTEGTGRRARIAEYSSGGKTGTAQIAGPGGYQEGQYVATFCGFAPVEAPRLVVLVSVTKPKGSYYGGTVSAPSVAAILRDALLYMRVPPRNQVLAQATGSE